MAGRDGDGRGGLEKEFRRGGVGKAGKDDPIHCIHHNELARNHIDQNTVNMD